MMMMMMMMIHVSIKLMYDFSKQEYHCTEIGL
jgi:hypothetical protein